MADEALRMGGAEDDSGAQARARIGRTLGGKWTLERLLGIGGMGAVYAGRHRNGASAAVKVLHPYLARDADARGRFLREGYAANRVEHPAVVRVLDDDVVTGGPDDGTTYLVMDLLVGESLEAMTRRGVVLTERDFLVVADVVLEVLEIAHARGVVHRDIKPDNIFITRTEAGRDRIKVLDFGLARLVEARSSTVHGIAIGTPPFMSPEQASGRNAEIDGRTDLFAIAATGFRLITGRRVHEGSSAIDVLQKMGKLRAPRVRDVAPEVTPAFASILDRALEFRREDRYESASAMRVEVLRALAVLDLRVPGPRDAAGNPSIELSAADFSAIQSVELSVMEELASRASVVAGSDRIEVSGSDLETHGSNRPPPQQHPVTRTQPMLAARPISAPPPAARVGETQPLPPATRTSAPPSAPVERRVAPTEPMLATDPIVALPSQPPPDAPRISAHSAPPSPPTLPRKSGVRVVVLLALLVLGAILGFVWMSPSATDSTLEPTSAHGTPIAKPAATTRLVQPVSDPPPKLDNRER